ncbi:expressed unknown protein [Seminavis robusta]|uniref:Uncharacterized protein n=1 Tax=Seminavis robusta TaxID=568900 RepID=A0A9N8ED98_9STRA|nr:expressed unknown protein [Seminavis robusta]|eukprot:Sro1008_g230590.1 n/a (229) ;mRNA; r:27953-28639
MKGVLLISASLLVLQTAAGQLVPNHAAGPLQPPQCDAEHTEACVTPWGTEGYFVCRLQQEQQSSLRAGNDHHRQRQRRQHGPPLSRSHCVPTLTAAAATIEHPEFRGFGVAGAGNSRHPAGPRSSGTPVNQLGHRRHQNNNGSRSFECGCCGGICPTKILEHCGCSCDLIHPDGHILSQAGVKVAVEVPDGSIENHCVHPQRYADAGPAVCLEDCSVSVQPERQYFVG